MAGSTWPTLVAGARAKASEVEAKFDWLEQDLVPMAGGSKADASYDLGQSSFRFRDGYFSRQVLLPAGSAGTPSLSQQGSANGFYFPTTSQIAATNPFLAANGAVGAPSLALVNSPTTGFYRVAANNIALASAGVKTWDVSSAGQITSPLQPGFSAYWTGTNTAISMNGASQTLTSSWSELSDKGTNFSGGVFTAPITGLYMFNYSANFNVGNPLPTTTTEGLSSHYHILYTTQRSYVFRARVGTASGGFEGNISFSLPIVMNTSDIAYMAILGTLATTTSELTLRGFENSATLGSGVIFGGTLLN